VSAESEGLDVLIARGGVLHWLLSPFPPDGRPPTYGQGHSELLTFVPIADARLRLSATPSTVKTGRTVTLTATVTQRYGGRLHKVVGARVSAAGVRAVTSADGTARLRVRRRHPGTLQVTATKQRLLPGRATLRVVA
jgi:hypothetical protein